MNLNINDYFDALNNNYILLLTSNSKEKYAINKVIERSNNLNIGRETMGCSIGLIDGLFVVHVTGTSGISYPNSLGRIVLSIIDNNLIPSPALVILLGICWGNPANVHHGDTIVSTRVCSLNSTVVQNDSVTHKDLSYDSTLNLECCADALASISETIKIGQIGSLETKYASTEKRDHLLNQYPSLYGGEMEAFGFIPSIDRKVPWLIVKNVSDFGDDHFNKDTQQAAVLRISDQLPAIIGVLRESHLVDLQNKSAAQLALKSTLIGDTISMYKKDISSDSLNDYLNDYIGPDLLWKLQSYSTTAEYNENFADNLCCLLLELSQNSFKYGAANYVRIHFYNDKVVIEEDSKAFDLNQLSGSNGGARAWNTFKTNYIDNGTVIYSCKSKQHKFVLRLLDDFLTETKSKCTARVRRNAVGSGFIGSGVLEYDERCDAIYIDVRNVLLRSREIIVSRDIMKVIEEGKIVFVACKNKQQEEDFRADLGPDTDNLRIFVDRM